MRRETGFTLIELLMTMIILGFVLAGISQTFTGILTQFKQQSKIAETSIEGIVGLELLRLDLENAGYGLPWRIPDTVVYDEAAAATVAVYNDCSGVAPCNPPRAFVVEHEAVGSLNLSDVLIIKATNIERNVAAQKWTHINSANEPRAWIPPLLPEGTLEDLANTDRVIVLEPGTSDGTRRTLVTDSAASALWRTTFGGTLNFTPGSGYNFVYGIGGSDIPVLFRMPFNRADYYILQATVPQRCAPNTGVLVKSMISQSNGARLDPMPLLDCVADMQVVFRLDRDGEGSLTDLDPADVLTDPAAVALTAQQIRDQVKEVRVYILAHEGQMDKSYTHPTSIIRVGEVGSGGHDTNIGTNVNYRWKLYTLVVKPKNLK